MPSAPKASAPDLERFVTTYFNSVKAYSQVVLGIGYAAIFATWAFTKEYLAPWEVLWSALLAVISVFVFVAVEAVNTVIMSAGMMKAGLRKTPEAALAAIAAQEVRPKLYMTIFGIGWLISFLCGVASAIILLEAFVHRLLFR
jgi:hypothetical protein